MSAMNFIIELVIESDGHHAAAHTLVTKVMVGNAVHDIPSILRNPPSQARHCLRSGAFLRSPRSLRGLLWGLAAESVLLIEWLKDSWRHYFVELTSSQ